MFNHLGRFAAAHPWIICGSWLLASLLLFWAAPAWNTKAQDDDIRFLPERCPSVRGYHLLGDAFPRDVFASRIIFAIERPDRVLTEADFALVDRCVADLQQLRHDEPALQIGKIVSYRDPLTGSRMIGAARHCTLIQVSLGTPYLALRTREAVDRAEALLRRRFDQTAAGAPRLLTTGPAGIGRDLTRASADSLDGTTLATVALVIVVLLLVYRAPLLALIPIITIAVSVWVSLQALALLTLIPGVYLVNVSKVFAIVMLYGAGTDYCLFLVSRYCEELENGYGRSDAIRRSVACVGGALAASAGTVICGLGLMGFAEFAKVRCAGPAIALSLAAALLASLTLAPALLRLFGRMAFWPRTLAWQSGRVGLQIANCRFEIEKQAASASFQSAISNLQSAIPPSGSPTLPRFWEWISRGVVARPLLVWSAAALALAPLAILGLRVTPVYKATGELHPSADSVRGLAAIQRHFPAGEIGPLTVLLEADTDWGSPQGREVVAHLCRGFGRLDNVAEVRSLTQPLGVPLPGLQIANSRFEIEKQAASASFQSAISNLQSAIERGALATANRAAREFYVAELPGERRPRFVTRVDVVMRSDPFEAASYRTLDLIQTWLDHELPRSASRLGGLRAECYGVTVNARDLAQVTEADRARVNTLVVAGILLILLVLVRRPWLAAYLLLTVLFSYYATLGATALAGSLWSGRPLGQVDWRVPFFLFTILIAVGEDYNILLITRVLQERQRHGAEEGIRRALARTGGTITSCGLIMAGTFATLMLAGLGTLVQIGFALAFGVLIDTFIVRPFLVPAFTLLMWRGKKKPAAYPWPRTIALERRRAA